MATCLRRLPLLLSVAVACGDPPQPDADDSTSGSHTEGSSTGLDDGPTIELPPRATERSCFFEGNPPGLLPQLSLEPMLEGVQLDQPVAVTATPARPNTLWIAERTGRMLEVDLGDPVEARTVIDLELGADTTLEAVAFSPDFEHSGHVFVRTHRHASPAGTMVSRLTLDADDMWVPGSNRLVLTVPFAVEARAGGALWFDATGMLLVALGDGGLPGERPAAAQDPSTRHGTILRLDPAPIDETGTYGIPADNPRVDDPVGTAAEAWAWGVRDPKHCSVDRASGDLWCGDVGELEQEVGRVPAGGNLGWPIFEGKRCRGTSTECDVLVSVIPHASYGHDGGDCEVVGGVVYRGTAFPELQGAYLYADRCSGRIRGVRLRADGNVEHNEVLGRIEGTPVAFGEDAEGEVYLIDGDEGTLWHVGVADRDKTFPVRLSESGCFRDLAALDEADDLVPFEINAPLWSDGTLKYRHIVLPPHETIGIAPDGTLAFPVDTYLLKTFVLEREAGDAASRVPVETRLMIRRDHGWEFHSYRWDEAGTDATLLSRGEETVFALHDEAGVTELHYIFPDRFACRACHGSSPSRALGPRIDQLDRRVQTDAGRYEQLDALEAIGMFDSTPPALTAVADPTDEDASLEARARAYLHGNCGHCHRPGGWVPPDLDMDLRWDRTLEETRICGVPPQYFNPWADGSARVSPGEPDDSLLWQRIDQRGPGQMPPLGTTMLDHGAEVVRLWITSLQGCE